MAAPTNVQAASTNGNFNDGALSYGTMIVTMKRPATFGVGGTEVSGAATLGTYILENLSIQRASKTIERPDELGGPNGFVLVNAQVKGSCTIQLGPVVNNRMKNGDFFVVTIDPIGAVAETFVLHDLGEVYGMNDYFKQTANLIKANFASTD